MGVRFGRGGGISKVLGLEVLVEESGCENV